MQKREFEKQISKLQKKAVTPLVSTVILIMIVVVLALIIIAWSGVFFKEAITKEIAGEKKTAEQRCSEIVVESFINPEPDETFGFKNIGNIPIYSIKIKLSDFNGGSSIITMDEFTGGVVNPSFSVTLIDIESGGKLIHSNYEQVKIIPILLGTSESGEVQKFQCPESNSFII
jgi:flagellin-like protein